MNWETVLEEVRYLQRYLEMPNTDLTRQEKWFGLVACGISEEEADRLCEPKEIRQEDVMKAVSEIMAKERRALAREQRI